MQKKYKERLLYVAKNSRRQDGQRLGQRIFNLIAEEDVKSGRYTAGDGESYQRDFHTRLFYIEDDELAHIIGGQDAGQ